jgi:hypothetical protein
VLLIYCAYKPIAGLFLSSSQNQIINTFYQSGIQSQGEHFKCRKPSFKFDGPHERIIMLVMRESA